MSNFKKKTKEGLRVQKCFKKVALIVKVIFVFAMSLIVFLPHGKAKAISYKHLTIPNAQYCYIQELNYGDVNEDGAIDIQDVTIIMKHVLALETLDGHLKNIADVNFNGRVNVQDVTLLMQYVLGLIENLPATEIIAQFEPAMEEFQARDYKYNGRLYIFVSYGSKPTPGYGVEITDLLVEDEKLLVTVHFTEADPDQAYPQVITCPYDLVLIEDLGLPVEYIATGAENEVPVN